MNETRTVPLSEPAKRSRASFMSFELKRLAGQCGNAANQIEVLMDAFTYSASSAALTIGYVFLMQRRA